MCREKDIKFATKLVREALAFPENDGKVPFFVCCTMNL
jgi:hypothetical protein